MSQNQLHQFKNLFLASPSTYDTQISASSGVTAIVAAAGHLLEVWQIDVDGRASNAGTAGLFIRKNNSTGEVIRFIQVAAGESKVVTFGGLPKKVSAVWFQTIGEGVRVAVQYVPRRIQS